MHGNHDQHDAGEPGFSLAQAIGDGADDRRAEGGEDAGQCGGGADQGLSTHRIPTRIEPNRARKHR